MGGLTDDKLRTVVEADINSADIFTADSQHNHNHSTDEQHHSHEGAVAGINELWIHQLVNDQI